MTDILRYTAGTFAQTCEKIHFDIKIRAMGAETFAKFSPELVKRLRWLGIHDHYLKVRTRTRIVGWCWQGARKTEYLIQELGLREVGYYESD